MLSLTQFWLLLWELWYESALLLGCTYGLTGTQSVVITAILSGIFLKERLSFVGKVGCFMCIIGSVVIVINAPEQSSVSTIQDMKHFILSPGFLSYASVVIVGCICVVIWVAPNYGKKSMMVYLTVCSLIGGLR